MNIYAGKPYDCFLLLGRFHHFHIGHESLVDTAFKLCDRGLLLIGSAEKSGVIRNPYDISTRIDVVREIYGDALEVKPIEDMTDENDIRPEWGDFVLERADRYISKRPDVMVYGNDEFRSRWFSAEAIKDTLEIVVPRSKIDISGTKIREFLLRGQEKLWQSYVNPKLHKHFLRLRTELLKIPAYVEMYEEWCRSTTKTTNFCN